MANPKPSDASTKYYFYNDATRIVYYSDFFIDEADLIYVGSSDNPNPKMAMAAFLQDGKVSEGYRLKDYDSL